MFSFFASVLLLLSKLLNIVQAVELPRRHYIAVPILMEAGGTQTVRWDAVNSILPGIEQEINNSPAEQQYKGIFRTYCPYAASFFYRWKESILSLLYAFLGVIHQSLLCIYHTVLRDILWNYLRDEVIFACEYTVLQLISHQSAAKLPPL